MLHCWKDCRILLFTIARQHCRIVFGHFCVCDILDISYSHTHTHTHTHTTGTNDKGLERAARCAEKLQRLGESEENWISLVQRVRKDRERVLRRARGLVRTISDLEEKQSFEDVERVRKLCNDIHSICNEIDSMIVEKITTSELHDLHVQCLEARARVLRRIQSSKMMEAGLEAGLARLASAENSPQPESSQHVSKAVEWLRAAKKSRVETPTEW